MGLINRPVRGAAIAVLGLAVTAMTGAFATSALASAPPAPHYVALAGSAVGTGAARTGSYSSSRMSVEVALAPRNTTGLQKLLQELYTKGNKRYEQWLAKGQFDRRFGPSAATQAAVDHYLSQEGLTVTSTSSPFLVRAVGSSQHMSAAFDTTLSMYKDASGGRFFANATDARLPASVASGVLGVLGLNNAVREHDMIQRATAVRPAGRSSASSASSAASAKCETGYPTEAQLVDLYVDGVSVPLGYGDGPGCSGMTPSQTNSINDPAHVGPKGKGKGVTLAVFELSAYRTSDIDTWAHYFYGKHFTPPLENVNVDGGPLHPRCPKGDVCPADEQGYAGDIEVDADIETQLTISPDAAHIIVYNAPNDETGQTELAEYTKIANDDSAASVSSSWGECESELGASMAKAEDVVFEQMAAQGQSMFASAGDDGAYDCGTPPQTLAVDDPESQPWVTSVGGTSQETDNPGTNAHPAYPAAKETVWNVDNLCNESTDEGGETGLFWCNTTGAGGGGIQQLLGPAVLPARPGHQQPVHHPRQRHDPVRVRREGRRVPRGARRLGQRRPVHAVRGVLHRERGHAEQRLRNHQLDSGWLVRRRRDQPVLSALVRDRSRPRQLPGPPERKLQPDAVPPVPGRPGQVLPRHRHLRQRADHPRHERQLPDRAGIRRGHRDRHPEDGGPDHDEVLTDRQANRLRARGDSIACPPALCLPVLPQSCPVPPHPPDPSRTRPGPSDPPAPRPAAGPWPLAATG